MPHGEEERLSSLLRDRALDEVAALAIDTYGGELYGFLLHVVGEPASAEEAFSRTIEDFWRGLPGFRGGVSVRTWLYQLGHRAALRHHRTPCDRAPPARVAPPPRTAATRTLTASGRTDVKPQWGEIRRELAPEDRALLVLRVDRNLAWNEIAEVMQSESSEDASAGAMALEAARRRERFLLLKDQLRVRARAAGLR